MRTISIEFKNGEPLYMQLYSYIKNEILNKSLKPGERLPSKRVLSSHLNISLNTVIEAYNLLLDEELITSEAKKGYFVTNYNISKESQTYENIKAPEINTYKYDFSTKNIDETIFPYYTWNKISKEIIYNEKILKKSSPFGYYDLRNTIKSYLLENKGISVNPNNIIIGSGIEYLLTIISNILDVNGYTVENPGYDKIFKILKNNNKTVSLGNIDDEGLVIDNNTLDCIYITPSNQFPTGVKMSLKRKTEISNWAKGNRYIIEDEFDSEFKYLSNQSISIFELNKEHTIYLQTYSRSISPALRIAYMILPDKLLEIYKEKFSFYSTTVSTLDQMILNEFIKSGAYSRHLNKTKLLNKEKRKLIISLLSQYEFIDLDIYNSYLSLIATLPEIDKDKFRILTKENDMDISLLDDYALDSTKSNKLIIGYSGINISDITPGIEKLINIIMACIK